MKHPRRIALSSTGPLSGKTTLANYLLMHCGFIHAKHYETLYMEYVMRYNATHDVELTTHRLSAEKEAHRQALQETGIQIGFDDPERAPYWIEKTLNTTAIVRWEVVPTVFDSIRGERQAQVLRDLGFIIVQLVVPESVRLHRAGSNERYLKLRENMGAHPDIEYGIIRPDIILPGDQPVGRLAEALVGHCEGGTA